MLVRMSGITEFIVKQYLKVALAPLLFCLQACSMQVVEQRLNSSPTQQVVISEGQAVISNGSVLLARKQAIQDAIRQASLQAGVRVKSHSVVNRGALQSDSFSMHSAAAVSNTQILDERVVDDIVTVRAKVTLSSDDSCRADQRKRIIATAFPLVEPSQVGSSETQDLYSGIPREINNVLMESKDFISRDATHISLYENPALAPELGGDDPYKTSKVMQMAANQGVQLVLAGVIRDIQIESGDYIRGSGPAGMAKSWLRDIWSRRGIGIDVYIYDGFTGALLLQNRYKETVAGDVWLPTSYTVGSERFNATETGAKIAAIIEQASEDIRHSLSCYPFASRIIKIEGDKLYVDAGAQENLHAGDQLVVYADASDDLKLDGGSHFIARDKRPVGVLTLSDIRTRYAMGSLDVLPTKVGIKVGDWVKFR
jgi:hypothetical protein